MSRDSDREPLLQFSLVQLLVLLAGCSVFLAAGGYLGFATAGLVLYLLLPYVALNVLFRK